MRILFTGMKILYFDDDWAALYDQDGFRVFEGHTREVERVTLEKLGVKYAHASAAVEEATTDTGSAPGRWPA